VAVDELRAWCKGRISHQKVPRYFKARCCIAVLSRQTDVVTSPPCRTPAQVVDAFPTTASGKPQKFCMREAAVAELGLQASQPLVAAA
jgi:fatty-acyl-CoA synthase